MNKLRAVLRILRKVWAFGLTRLRWLHGRSVMLRHALKRAREAANARERRPATYPLFVPHLIRWGFQQGIKWVFLALALVCFILGGFFAFNNPFGVSSAYGMVRLVREAQGGSLVLCVSFLTIGWFLVSHFRLLHRKARPRDD